MWSFAGIATFQELTHRPSTDEINEVHLEMQEDANNIINTI